MQRGKVNRWTKAELTTKLIYKKNKNNNNVKGI